MDHLLSCPMQPSPALALCPGGVFAAPGLAPWPAGSSVEVGSSFQKSASQTEPVSPHTGNRKRQLVCMCQLRKRSSLLCCSVVNSDLDAKCDRKPGLLNPVFAGGTALWFSLSFNSNSSLLALPTSDMPAEIQPLPTEVFLRYLSPTAYTGTTGVYGPPVEDHCSNRSVSA